MTNPNDTAFPCESDGHGGLTKREFIASQQLAALHSNNALMSAIGGYVTSNIPDYLSGVALEYTDALIKRLNSEQETKTNWTTEGSF